LHLSFFHVFKTFIFRTNSLVTREIVIVVSSLRVFIFFFLLSHIHIFGYTAKTVTFGVDFIYARVEERWEERKRRNEHIWVKSLYFSEMQEECKHMREWVKNIYFLSTNQFSYSKMSEASNNMAPQRGDRR
jgi:hypothetical protein